jgi:CelD/BcsL family acetyltransferase involved in cellulose biosynthesis
MATSKPEVSSEAQQPHVSTSQLTARTEVGGVELLETISGDARRLCEEAHVSEPFYRLDWSEAFYRSFSPKGKLVLISVWDSKRLRGFLPLILTRGSVSGLPARILTSCANTHCCRFDLVCCDGAEREQVLRAMWKEIRQLRSWDVLDFPYTKDGSGISELLGFAVKDHYPVAKKFAWQALYCSFPEQADGSEPWLVGTNRKFRANLRRTDKLLKEQGPVSFEHYRSADPDTLESFFQLEASGWKGKEGTAIACRPETRKFYELVAAAASRDGYFSLDFLKLDGKPISAHFAMVWDGRYQLLKAAYDENYRRFGPGHLIVWELLRSLGPSGLTELDFVAPATWDESCWASENRSHFSYLVFSRTIYGKVLHFMRISGRALVKSILRRPTHNAVPAIQN